MTLRLGVIVFMGTVFSERRSFTLSWYVVHFT